MNLAAMMSRQDKIIIVPIQSNFKQQLHSIQTFGERFMDEFLILSSAPGEIELNPNWTWKLIIDPGLYDVDQSYIPIPMYKDQQH